MSLSCLGIYHVSSSLTCYVYFMLCSIFFKDVFVFHLSFIFSFILHPSCIIFYPCSFSLLLLDSFVYSWQKGGEYTGVFRHLHMTHVHILRGRNSISYTFVRGESHKGDTYTKGEKTYFLENLVLFCFVLYYAFFLIVLWCFELHLSSMLCCSHRIMFMCWTCIYLYAIVLYWLHVRMIICFAMWSL